MKGALTQQEMELRKIKARNLDEALEFIDRSTGSGLLRIVARILRRDLKSREFVPESEQKREV